MLDSASTYFSTRKGLLPLLGILMIIANFIIQFIVPGWFGTGNVLLHVGLVIALFGLMLAWAL